MNVHNVNIVLLATWNYNANSFTVEKKHSKLVYFAYRPDKYRMPVLRYPLFVINFSQLWINTCYNLVNIAYFIVFITRNYRQIISGIL